MKKHRYVILPLLMLLSLACGLPTLANGSRLTPRAEVQTTVPSKTARPIDIEPTTAFTLSTATWAPLASATATLPLPTEPNATPLPPLPELTQTFTDSQDGLTLQYPQGWFRTQLESIFQFCPSKEAQSQATCLNIAVHDDQTSLADFEKNMTDLWSKNNDARFTPKSKLTVGGQNGVLDEINDVLSGMPRRGLAIFVVVGSKGYAISFMTPVPGFDWLQAITLKVVKTITFLQAPFQVTFEDKVYEDPGNLFVLHYPKAWSVVTNAKNNYVSFCQDSKNVFSCLDVHVDKQPGALPAFASKVQEDISSRAEKFTVLSTEQATIDNAPAIWLNASFTLNGVPLKGSLVFTIQNGVGLYFNAMEKAASWPTLNNQWFDQMIKSVQYVKP